MDETKVETESRVKRNAQKAAGEAMPVKIIRPVRLKSHQTYMILGIIMCSLLGIMTIFSGISLFNVNRRMAELTKQVETLNKEISSYSKPRLQVAGTRFEVTWNENSPLDFMPLTADGTVGDAASPTITIENSTSNALSSVNAVWNQNSIQALVTALNKADKDYVYTTTFENNDLTLAIEPKEGGEPVKYEGSIMEAAGTLSSTTEPFVITVNDPIDEMINRLVVLNEAGSISLSLKLNAIAPDGSNMAKTIEVTVDNTDVTQPIEPGGPGSAAYNLNAVLN